MKTTLHLTFGMLLLTGCHLSAATRYVSLESTNPTPPYTMWALAATNIQDAVNAAAAGDLVLVTNGVYPGGMAVTNPLALLSVNGPEVTIIDGVGTHQCVSLPEGASLTGFTLTNGHGIVGAGVFCASSNAFLTNCVISGNHAVGQGTTPSGQVGRGGGVSGGTLYICRLIGNSALGYSYHTGVRPPYVYHHVPGLGGGAVGSTLWGCTLTGNSSDGRGGGAANSTFYNCAVSGNSAPSGGGASGGTLRGCTLTGNSSGGGGGVADCTLYNCALGGNSATNGGGAFGGTLYNCTLTGNAGGGVSGAALYNCIVYFNTASGEANSDPSSTLDYCCTTPLPARGTGNITLDPQLASASHLSAHSPCRGVGRVAYATGIDMDGEPWADPPSMGCDEYNPGAVTGPLTVGLVANYTNVAVGYSVSLTALIEGRTTDSAWDFGDGMVVSNRPYASHAWAAPGDYAVVLQACNESLPGGVSATLAIHVEVQPVIYVAETSTDPQPPYASWATAATNIQDAVNVVTLPGALVLVDDGVYAGGVIVTSPITLQSVSGPEFTAIDGGGSNSCMTLHSSPRVVGFSLTNGSRGVDCASTDALLTNCVITGNTVGAWGGTLYNCTLAASFVGGAYEAVLYNCTLTNNSSGRAGAGASGCVLYNCTLTGNSSDDDGGGAATCVLHHCSLIGNAATGGYGGGAFDSTLYSCALTGNISWGGGGVAGGTIYSCTLSSNLSLTPGGGASGSMLYNCTLSGNTSGGGGGASGSALYNCTLTGNSASGAGGGAVESTLYNCILYFNTASEDANYDSSRSLSTLSYCCTTPLPTNGVGNIATDPGLVDAAAGDFRLRPGSPCINAGNNSYVATAADLDGHPRIVNGTVDIGGYEYQGAGSSISYAWLQQYGLPTDGSADYADPDHDGMNNWQEWICGTCPTNASSLLMLSASTQAAPGLNVTWPSVDTRTYYLQRSTSLSVPSAFSTIQSNILGQAGITTYTDANAVGAGPFFYRVGVHSP